jgi:hypothetical protein
VERTFELDEGGNGYGLMNLPYGKMTQWLLEKQKM